MTAERQQRCLDALAQFKNKPAADIQLAQADAILAIKTIHIGKQRKMMLGSGEINHSGSGENRQFWSNENHQSGVASPQVVLFTRPAAGQPVSQ